MIDKSNVLISDDMKGMVRASVINDLVSGQMQNPGFKNVCYRSSEGNTGLGRDSPLIVLLCTCSNSSDCLLITILFKHFRHPERPAVKRMNPHTLTIGYYRKQAQKHPE